MSERYYLGTRGPGGLYSVTVHDGDKVRDLTPRTTGSWGHTGCNPDRALEILADHCPKLATKLGARFNEDVVEKLNRNLFKLTAAEIDAWLYWVLVP